MAGFHHEALVEIDTHACETLQKNRPNWNVIQADIRDFDIMPYRGIDLLAGGVPCPPFSIAGQQLGEDDERNLFDEAIHLVDQCRPKAVMLENVRGLLDPIFDDYRKRITSQIEFMGYKGFWRLLNASDFGVPQRRPRVVFVALQEEYASYFYWPEPKLQKPPTVGEALFEQMAARGWRGAEAWRETANSIAPTIVGGSKKHGGPDLGPTRAKREWAKLGVDGHGIANEPPSPDFTGLPRLTVKMAAMLQGFPVDWDFAGKKTPAYRQVGNAFPPPVAKAVAEAISNALRQTHDFSKLKEGECQIDRVPELSFAHSY
jgi:DNA (cytosine-5)-methyltransferase 1